MFKSLIRIVTLCSQSYRYLIPSKNLSWGTIIFYLTPSTSRLGIGSYLSLFPWCLVQYLIYIRYLIKCFNKYFHYYMYHTYYTVSALDSDAFARLNFLRSRPVSYLLFQPQYSKQWLTLNRHSKGIFQKQGFKRNEY